MMPSQRAEILLTILALCIVAWLMWPLQTLVEEGDGRFLPDPVQELALPKEMLSKLCPDFRERADAKLQAFCKNQTSSPGGGGMLWASAPPAILAESVAKIAKNFQALEDKIQNEIQALRNKQKERLNKKTGEEIGRKTKEKEAYLKRYGPLYKPGGLLQCVSGVWASAWAKADDDGTRADLSLWFAAILEGKQASLSDRAYRVLDTAWWQYRKQARDQTQDQPLCEDGAGLPQAGRDLAKRLDKAHDKINGASKDSVMRHLLASAWWQWPVWMILTMGLVMVSRHARLNRWRGTGLVLLIWGVLAWIGKVWIPWKSWFGEDPNLSWSRETAGALFNLPPWPVWMMMATGGGLCWYFSGERARRGALAQECSGQSSSRFALAGLALFAGLGWLVLLDLSATGYEKNRYLALYQQGYLWVGLGLVVLASLWRQPVAGLLWRISGTCLRRYDGFAKTFRRWLTGLVLLVVVVVCVSLMLRGMRQFTSELGRLWLIFGLAWFFCTLGPQNLKHAQTCKTFLTKIAGPFCFVAVPLLFAMFVTRDMGPLLLDLYCLVPFLVAAYAYTRRGQVGAWGLFLQSLGFLIAGCFALTAALFICGDRFDLVAERLESVAMPLVSVNDQIGIISWFREASPAPGFGVGNVPWCGDANAEICQGVPRQIHSDYSFTALWGIWGPWASFLLVALSLIWLVLLILRHWDIADDDALLRGKPNPQAFLSWMCVSWLILNCCQIIVTVAGNLRVLPLTGITYPFISYGMLSLWVNAVFLGLAMSINREKSGG